MGMSAMWLLAFRLGLLTEKQPWLRAYDAASNSNPTSFYMGCYQVLPRAKKQLSAPEAELKVHRHARRLYRRCGNQLGIAWTLWREIWVRISLTDWSQSETADKEARRFLRLINQAEKIAIREGDHDLQLRLLSERADACSWLGRRKKAKDALVKAIWFADVLEEYRPMICLRHRLAAHEGQAQQFEDAERLLEEAALLIGELPNGMMHQKLEKDHGVAMKDLEASKQKAANNHPKKTQKRRSHEHHS